MRKQEMGLSLDQQTSEEDLGAEHVVRSTELNNEAILLKGGPWHADWICQRISAVVWSEVTG